MTIVNSNFSTTIPDTNKAPLGSDNPGQQQCPNCRQTVTPHPTNGILSVANGTNAGKANVGFGTSAGYSCPACGHNFTWTKSTGVQGGPRTVDHTNQNSAADM